MTFQSELFANDSRLQAAAQNQPPLRNRESGDAIKRLQLALLYRGFALPVSTKQMSLVPDGIFGSETKGAVEAFQKANGLATDGVPGKMTLSKLDELMGPTIGNVALECDNCRVQNQGKISQLMKAVADILQSEAAAPQFLAASFAPAAAAKNKAQLPTNIKHLTGPQETAAKAVYKSSLDFSRIFISDAKGIGGRGFTVAIPVAVPLVGTLTSVVVINCGTFAPSNRLLIHELAHAWQSQHHSEPTAFMKNSIASQGLADGVKALGGGKASAYAYFPGKAFAGYAGEQIAQQVENNEASIVAHVASVSANLIDPSNIVSLSVPRYEIVGAPGVKK